MKEDLYQDDLGDEKKPTRADLAAVESLVNAVGRALTAAKAPPLELPHSAYYRRLAEWMGRVIPKVQ